MNKWKPIQKPAETAEQRLLDAILCGHFAVNSSLPGERDLAEQVGVTRPTLREAMQRLARDGWLDIQHGKPTRVRDYWLEGNMGVLTVLAQMPAQTWFRVEIEAALGKAAPRTFQVKLTPAGGATQTFAGLPIAGAEFRELVWLGYSSTAAADTVFYLDNVTFTP